MRRLHVAVAQVNARAGDPWANIERMHRQIRSAAAVGVEAILFAESVVQAYDMSAANLKHAQPLSGPLCRRLLAFARRYRMTICAGLFEREGARIFNSCVVAWPDGRIDSQRKHSLTPGEIKAGVVAGEKERKVFVIGGIRVGILVCADTGIPDVGRLLRAKGVEYRFIPTAGGGKLADMLHEGDLRRAVARKRYTENRPRVFNAQAILPKKDLIAGGFASTNAMGYDGKNACHQGHCMIVDNRGVMRVQIPGTIVLEHQQDQMGHCVLTFD